MKVHPRTINIIQIYAPTEDKPVNEIAKFYKQMKEALKHTVGSEISTEISEKHGLGERNERRERLIDFCQEEKILLTNTWFTLPKRKLYTWKSPADKEDQIVRNLINYVLINHRFRNAVKWTKTYPRADANTDHILLCAAFNIKLKKIGQRIPNKKVNLNLLKDLTTRNDGLPLLYMYKSFKIKQTLLLLKH